MVPEISGTSAGKINTGTNLVEIHKKKKIPSVKCTQIKQEDNVSWKVPSASKLHEHFIHSAKKMTVNIFTVSK